MKTNYKQKIFKIARRALFISPFLIGGIAGLLYWLAPSMIAYPRRITLPGTPADHGLPYEKIGIETPDSIRIAAYYVHEAGDTTRPTLILVHGIGGCKEMWLQTAAWLWKEGYASLLLDLRAHGQSGGQHCTYGYKEKNDVKAVVKYLRERSPGAPIGIWGNSLGGAVALQSLAVEPGLRFGLVESTFADFREVVYAYQRRWFKIPWRGMADSGIERAAALARFDPDAIRPGRIAADVHQPVFMAHGEADPRIHVDNGRQIFANLAAEKKELHIIPGAGHTDVMRMGGDAYRKAILQFLATNAQNERMRNDAEMK